VATDVEALLVCLLGSVGGVVKAECGPCYETDLLALRIIVDEAVANARKYRQPESPVTCTVRVRDGKLLLEIENVNASHVAALTPDECENVFLRGYSAPNRCETSTGVGLNSVRAAAAAANGRVALRTRTDGARALTALLLEMPATPTAAAPRDASAGGVQPARTAAPAQTLPACTPAGGLLVLVADDIGINRMLMIRQLSRIFPGSRFMQATRASEVGQLSAEHEFDLIVTDEEMEPEGVSEVRQGVFRLGSDAIAEVRRRESLRPDHPPAVIVSCTASMTAAGDTDAAFLRRISASGADLVPAPPPALSPRPKRISCWPGCFSCAQRAIPCRLCCSQPFVRAGWPQVWGKPAPENEEMYVALHPLLMQRMRGIPSGASGDVAGDRSTRAA
jgi:CheY-like chemotaxis protein